MPAAEVIEPSAIRLWAQRLAAIAILFTGSFQAALFCFADLRRNRGFYWLKALFSPESAKNKKLSKRTNKKNRYFGTCKPAKYVLAL